jgi:hypothetical protein
VAPSNTGPICVRRVLPAGGVEGWFTLGWAMNGGMRNVALADRVAVATRKRISYPRRGCHHIVLAAFDRPKGHDG